MLSLGKIKLFIKKNFFSIRDFAQGPDSFRWVIKIHQPINEWRHDDSYFISISFSSLTQRETDWLFSIILIVKKNFKCYIFLEMASGKLYTYPDNFRADKIRAVAQISGFNLQVSSSKFFYLIFFLLVLY